MYQDEGELGPKHKIVNFVVSNAFEVLQLHKWIAWMDE